MHVSHDEVLTAERLAEYELNAALRMDVRQVQRRGANLPGLDGTVGGKPGLEVMNLVLDYFIGQERYQRCAVMRDRIAEYQRIVAMDS